MRAKHPELAGAPMCVVRLIDKGMCEFWIFRVFVFQILSIENKRFGFFILVCLNLRLVLFRM